MYSVAAEVGLPTGVLTEVGAAVAGQNARMLGDLMARYGVPVVGHEAFGALPLYLAESRAVIFPGMPPTTCGNPCPAKASSRPTEPTPGASS